MLRRTAQAFLPGLDMVYRMLDALQSTGMIVIGLTFSCLQSSYYERRIRQLEDELKQSQDERRKCHEEVTSVYLKKHFC